MDKSFMTERERRQEHEWLSGTGKKKAGGCFLIYEVFLKDLQHFLRNGLDSHNTIGFLVCHASFVYSF